MGIQDAERRKASQLVRQHRESAEAVVLRRDSGAIQRSTQDGTLTRATSDTDVSAIVESYKHYEVVASQNADAGTAIQPTDERCKIAVLDLGTSITPTPEDRIVRADGSLHTIVSVSTDKHNAWWILQLRRPG